MKQSKTRVPHGGVSAPARAGPMAQPDLAQAVDGRRRRAEHSRARIVAAMLDLVREGQAEPGAEAVAARAGVGRRTVFRLFKDMESLYLEMHAAMLARLEPLLAMPIEGESWRARLEAMIARRARIFEEMAPIKAAADARRMHSPFLIAQHARTNAMLREVLMFVLPKPLSQLKPQLEALDAALSFSMWRRLREDQGLAAPEATAILRALANAILSAPGSAEGN